MVVENVFYTPSPSPPPLQPNHPPIPSPQTLYLPVSVSFKGTKYEKLMHWVENNPYFYYPYVFVSPFVTGLSTTREDFRGAKYIVADSGGFQIFTHKKHKFSALDVLRWQESIADVGFTLDIPVASYESERSNYKYYTSNYFERCLQKSVENAYKMLEAKQNEKMQLWAVLQGTNYDDLKKWYTTITKEHDFDGYAIAMSPTPIAGVSKQHKQDWIGQLQLAKEIDSNIHFLGRCEPLLVLVLTKLSQITKKLYTYDSSSAAGALLYGKYHDPYFFVSLSFSKHKPEERVKLTKLPCDCPVCQKHSYDELIQNPPLTLLHNIYVRIRFNNYLNAIVKDDNIFENLLYKLLKLTHIDDVRRRIYEKRIKSLIYDEPKVEKLSSYF